MVYEGGASWMRVSQPDGILFTCDWSFLRKASVGDFTGEIVEAWDPGR